ncbi:hypothetical protein BGW80DRAFT_603998 [Lactifluus volemus]|nr:hypothetical protein BGW80DRAFT_603998 [Lactifluus volemus]
MARLVDIFSLLLTSAVITGSVIGITFLVRKCRAAIDATKAFLEHHGVTVSSDENLAVTVTGKGRVNCEQYLERTQRGFIKAMHAATFGCQAHTTWHDPATGQPTETLPNGIALCSGDDTSSEASSEHRDGRQLFRNLDGPM